MFDWIGPRGIRISDLDFYHAVPDHHTRRVLGERNGQAPIYRSGLGKTLLTVFLLNAHVALRPTTTRLVLRPTPMNSHIVLMPTTTSIHIVLRLTTTSNHVALRPTAISKMNISNRAFLRNLLTSHRAIRMKIITVTNLHAHVLSLRDLRLNKRMVTKSNTCALAALHVVMMIKALKKNLTSRRNMKGR